MKGLKRFLLAPLLLLAALPQASPQSYLVTEEQLRALESELKAQRQELRTQKELLGGQARLLEELNRQLAISSEELRSSEQALQESRQALQEARESLKKSGGGGWKKAIIAGGISLAVGAAAGFAGGWLSGR